MLKRHRRLRKNQNIRQLVRETRIAASALVYPIFIIEGEGIEEEITAMPGQFRYSIDRCFQKIEEMTAFGVRNFLLFGISGKKDAFATEAYNEEGIVQSAIRAIRSRFPDVYLITDVCMCEYSSYGHCGVVKGGEVDNDASLEILAKIALSHAAAGADMVAPSDMMDYRVGTIRRHLDQNGFSDIPLMSYSVKYASSFYGPFREAANSAPVFGDRKTYQMDYHNAREGIKEVLSDIEEGADIIMVKPALNSLDVLSRVRDITNLPLAAYSVSGEYAMVKAAGQKGWINEEELICEMAVSAFRAGADIYISYFAKEIAKGIQKGIIG